MDRRTFLRKISELAGISATGITLSKLQIATISTGLSSLLGCSRELAVDPKNPDVSEGNILLAPLSCRKSVFNCGSKNVYNCPSEYICELFNCNSLKKFMCNNVFGCDVGYVHDQGSSL